ncbi:MAG: DinB family protein [Chloroflexi bacterium]|nr:DinB family protein [Chloroflexota bacterium]
MTAPWPTMLWSQFEAAIYMLDHAIADCPDDLWHASLWGEHSDRPDLSQFWYVSFHTLFWLDLYLSGSVEGFAPPPPFTLNELDPAGVLPERPYTKAELQTYLAYCRRKCQTTLESLTDEAANRRCTFPWMSINSFGELLINTMRHVQEHGAQLRLFLGQQRGIEAGWRAYTAS